MICHLTSSENTLYLSKSHSGTLFKKPQCLWCRENLYTRRALLLWLLNVQIVDNSFTEDFFKGFFSFFAMREEGTWRPMVHMNFILREGQIEIWLINVCDTLIPYFLIPGPSNMRPLTYSLSGSLWIREDCSSARDGTFSPQCLRLNSI